MQLTSIVRTTYESDLGIYPKCKRTYVYVLDCDVPAVQGHNPIHQFQPAAVFSKEANRPVLSNDCLETVAHTG